MASPPATPRPARNASALKGLAMIPRYSRPDMVAIWSPETKFR
ncbi:MAG: adenylosuccinate lyase, partial [Polaromonas sp.]